MTDKLGGKRPAPCKPSSQLLQASRRGRGPFLATTARREALLEPKPCPPCRCVLLTPAPPCLPRLGLAAISAAPSTSLPLKAWLTRSSTWPRSAPAGVPWRASHALPVPPTAFALWPPFLRHRSLRLGAAAWLTLSSSVVLRGPCSPPTTRKDSLVSHCPLPIPPHLCPRPLMSLLCGCRFFHIAPTELSLGLHFPLA